MIRSRAAQRYARALFSKTKENQSLESVYKDIDASLKSLFQGDELQKFLSDPVIPPSVQSRALSVIFADAHPELREFVLFLVEKGRSALLKPIFESYKNLYSDHKGIIRAKVTSATMLDQAQLDAIAKRLKEKHNKDVELKAEINHELIGGFRIQIGDIIYDNTFLSQLEKFKQNLIGA